MPDYLPRFAPGESPVYVASATIVGGQLLEITGDKAVGPAGAASLKVVGVAATDYAIGDRVTIRAGGVQRIVAAAAGVTAGDTAAAGAAGTVQAVGGATFGARIGLVLSTAAGGVLADVQMDR